MTLFLILLDAFSFSYLNEKVAPFLYSFSKTGIRGRIKPMFAFEGISPTVYTGVWPNKHGIWTRFQLQTKVPFWRKNVFTLLNALAARGSIKKIQKDNFGKSVYYKGIQKLLNFGLDHLQTTQNIPPGIGHKFKYSLRTKNFQKIDSYNGYRSIFGVLKEKGWGSMYLFGDIEQITDYLSSFQNLKRYKLIAIHTLGELDTIAHKYGPLDPATLAYVAYTDTLITKFVDTVNRNIGESSDIAFVFFSDHGMIEVKRYLDISGFLREILERRTLVFVDSIIIRVWGNSKKLEYAKKLLLDLGGGQVLTDVQMKERQVNFQDNRYGDLIFIANPGVVFLPNFFHGNQPLKGMHGYVSDKPELSGVIVAKGKRISEAERPLEIEMVDIFPSILKLYGLTIPDYCNGKPFL